MEKKLLAVSAPPFWHCGRTIEKSMRLTMLALLPAVVMAGVNWGLPAVRVMALAVATAVLCEFVASRLMHRRVRVDDMHAMVIGLLFAFLLPSASPWWLVVLGTAITVLLGKMAFGGLGASPLSEPALGWAVLMISWPLLMDPNTAELSTSFIDPLVRLKFFGVAAAEEISWKDLVLGHQIGALGASQVGALCLGGILLCVRGVVRWEIPVSFLAGTVLTAMAFNMVDPYAYASPLFHLFTGSTILCAFFLATESSCSPNRQVAMAVYGLLGGILVVLIRNFGMYTDGAPFAVLLINLLMPQLELIRPKPFGFHQVREGR